MNQEIDQAHQRHTAALDPLLPVPQGLVATEGDHMVAAVAGTSAGYARVRTVELDPDSTGALWGPLRQHSLNYRIQGPDRAEVLRRLLDQWLAEIPVAGPDWETAASVTVPSRDPDCRIPLLQYGFAPLIVLAARRANVVAPSGSGLATVRPAEPADLPVLTEMAVQLHQFDVESGMLTARAGASGLLRDMLTEHLKTCPGWTWVAEIDCRTVGFGYVQPPVAADWIAPLAVAGSNPAYLAEMYIDPRARSTGIGADLAGVLHGALDQAGVGLTLLHHALPNPHSTPFWARMGYRPLWTSWQRRPVSGPPR